MSERVDESDRLVPGEFVPGRRNEHVTVAQKGKDLDGKPAVSRRRLQTKAEVRLPEGDEPAAFVASSVEKRTPNPRLGEKGSEDRNDEALMPALFEAMRSIGT